MTFEYATASAGVLAAAVAAGRVSALELTDEAIGAIEARDGPINAVVVRDFDRARDAAKAADAAVARGERGPLLGVPMTVKESHHILGLPTTRGQPEYEGWLPPFESVAVIRLRTAGAIILGKTNVPPHLADWQSANPIYGRTNNPHDLGRSPGGSSGGSAAALAAGMVPLECGSDIGGSIRVPAAFCGVFGLKPSYGVIPVIGHTAPPMREPGQAPEMSVVGPLARTASDLDLALSVLAGPAGEEAKGWRLELPRPRVSNLSDVRALVLDHHPLCETDAEVAAAPALVGELMAKAGAKVAYDSPRLPDLAEAGALYTMMLTTVMTQGAPGVTPVDAHTWLGMLNRRAFMRHRWRELFEEFDVVVAPPCGILPFPHEDAAPAWRQRTLVINGQETPYGAQSAWPGLASLVNLPAVAVPVTRSRSGLPIGVQLIGAYLDDRTTIAVAGMVERALGPLRGSSG